MYATRQLMIDHFGEPALIAMTGGSDAIVDSRLDVAIRAADAEINGYLQGVVTLPMASVPDIIRLHACSIAYYYLDRDNPTDGAKMGYQNAAQYLKRAQDGKAGLGLDEASAPVASDSDVHSSMPDRVYTDETLGGYG